MNRLGWAMADATCSRILLSLLENPGYPAQLASDLGLTRTNVSNHLACLRGCGIVVAEPQGRRTPYEISDPRLAWALRTLVEVTLAVDEGVPCLDVECALPSSSPCSLSEKGWKRYEETDAPRPPLKCGKPRRRGLLRGDRLPPPRGSRGRQCEGCPTARCAAADPARHSCPTSPVSRAPC